MADLIAPGTWWLHGTWGSNAYLVEAADGQLCIVDTGFARSARGIVKDLRATVPGRTVVTPVTPTFDPTTSEIYVEVRVS